MADARYRTARWQRLRRDVLARDGGLCQVQRRGCTGYATTVHHIYPSSQYPDLFWEPDNLQAACARCNYGGGAKVAAQNKQATIERLQALVVEQQMEIDRLRDRVAQFERAATRRARPQPAIG